MSSEWGWISVVLGLVTTLLTFELAMADRGMEDYDDLDLSARPKRGAWSWANQNYNRYSRMDPGSIIRLGKRHSNFLRLGRVPPDVGTSNFIRLGRADTSFIRYGKRDPSSFIRLGRSRLTSDTGYPDSETVNDISEDELATLIAKAEHKRSLKNFIRLGRSTDRTKRSPNPKYFFSKTIIDKFPRLSRSTPDAHQQLAKWKAKKNLLSSNSFRRLRKSQGESEGTPIRSTPTPSESPVELPKAEPKE
ncbi:unnamed protein product [Cyprideis torosa]|uniref:Uncharacterized protein n=1 Tax=Cyprideis torosa TaxID=163714 RepID=A0A7R8WGL2_9CRUS|nr:unnamed protein product [Cyprideis torosa]CAG0898227.1 unnamed protein product [Cyprideis torosa]